MRTNRLTGKTYPSREHKFSVVDLAACMVIPWEYIQYSQKQKELIDLLTKYSSVHKKSLGFNLFEVEDMTEAELDDMIVKVRSIL